jgi:proline iminopeptidase
MAAPAVPLVRTDTANDTTPRGLESSGWINEGAARALRRSKRTSTTEVQWITEDFGRIFPETWNEFSEAANANPGERAIEVYARRLAGEDRDDASRAAHSWDRWESTHISLDPNWAPGVLYEDERERMTFALLVAHYCRTVRAW